MYYYADRREDEEFEEDPVRYYKHNPKKAQDVINETYEPHELAEAYSYFPGMKQEHIADIAGHDTNLSHYALARAAGATHDEIKDFDLSWLDHKIPLSDYAIYRGLDPKSIGDHVNKNPYNISHHDIMDFIMTEADANQHPDYREQLRDNLRDYGNARASGLKHDDIVDAMDEMGLWPHYYHQARVAGISHEDLQNIWDKNEYDDPQDLISHIKPRIDQSRLNNHNFEQGLGGELDQWNRRLESNKKESYKPPAGVQAEARRALEWIKDGHAGSGFTDVGRKRASDLASGKALSLSTIKRMKSYLARHGVDKQGEGWSKGSKGYPSPGRVAWAAWGGDAAKSWVNGILGESDTKESKKKEKDSDYDHIIKHRKGEPTDKELYSQIKSEAKEKFDVYPSAVANAWVVKKYKERGGTYGKEKKKESSKPWYDQWYN